MEVVPVVGADLVIGLGEDHIPFFLARGRLTDISMSLQTEAAGGEIPVLRVDLASSLFLNETTPDGTKRTSRTPTFGQLVRAGLRTLDPLHRQYGKPLPEATDSADFTSVESVPTRRSYFAVFR